MPRLKVVLNGARNLPKKSLGRSPDPIVEMSIGGSRQKSNYKSSTVNPVWNETFMFNINNPQTDSLFIQLFDYETIGDNILMGNVSIRVNELARGVPESKELTLSKLKSGTLYITLTAEDFGMGGNTSQQAPQYNPSVQGTQQYHQRPPSMTNLHQQQQPYQPQQYGQVPQQQYGTQVSPQYSLQQQQQPYGTTPQQYPPQNPQYGGSAPPQNPQYSNNSSMSQIPVQQYQQQQPYGTAPQQYGGVYPQPSAPPSYGGSAPPQNPQFNNNSSMSQIPVQQYQQQQPYGTAPQQPYGTAPVNYPPQNPQFGGAPPQNPQYGAYPPQQPY
jgi:hypothetical protein